MNDSQRAALGELSETAERQNQFITANLRRIFLQILRIVGTIEDAQDLTQEVFIKALQRSEQLRDAEKASHWLSRIATNTAIDFLRRQGRMSFSALEDLPQGLSATRDDSPEQNVLRAEQSSVLEGGLRRLSERERLALLLRDVEGLPAEEVARELECSKATVRSHIANARVKFKRYLEKRRSS